MKIAVMLRTIDEMQGIGIYTKNLMDKLLPLDNRNEYVLLYKNPDLVGTYAQFDNVTERHVPGGHKAVWDQISVPRSISRDGVDLLFHTKFTVPLFGKHRSVMTIHGASWFVHPELYSKAGIAYIKTFMPMYCKKATAILSNSELTTNDFIRILKIDPAKIYTTRLGTNEQFRVVQDEALLNAARKKYNLPERYILSVVKYDPRKNFENLIAAFRLLRKRTDAKLVVIGIGCEKYIDECGLDSDGTTDDVTFLGWVDPENLPEIYTMADCLFFPSVYEEFGIPTCEAMACGIPVVVSKTGALPELTGEAGIHVDPFNPEEMCDALEKVVTDKSLRTEYSAKVLERAKLFTWDRCARETLDVINSLADDS